MTPGTSLGHNLLRERSVKDALSELGESSPPLFFRNGSQPICVPPVLSRFAQKCTTFGGVNAPVASPDLGLPLSAIKVTTTNINPVSAAEAEPTITEKLSHAMSPGIAASCRIKAPFALQAHVGQNHPNPACQLACSSLSSRGLHLPCTCCRVSSSDGIPEDERLFSLTDPPFAPILRDTERPGS